MIYLNISVATLDSVEFLGSEPVDRATWLCLLRYCCGQENGGLIRGARAWGDRRWQQLCRITKAEAMRESALWTWHTDDLLVHAYPAAQEDEVRAKRMGGSSGANARWNGSANGSAIAQPLPETEAQHPETHMRKGREGKEREGKGREGDDPTPIFHGLKIDTKALLIDHALPSSAEAVREWRAGLSQLARCRSIEETRAFMAWAIQACARQGVHVEYWRHVRVLAVEWDQGQREKIFQGDRREPAER